ncbi:hypothetical protein [Streptomyces sp. AP-93]|uniref:hypothetical protein n=1 Tax=Streptomyces sp. AP-93 TaxID=2929048 RepID=UPI001FAEF01F|nr:hypothetical protein [Streptomyces sp. AP-93]MCJ0874246.1 hypothetical protein [Streptomyces sp. AP-93]
MTALGTHHGDTGPCDPGPCAGDELPVNPFLALRVAFGMLLGEDDFRVLMGNPRGKLMLHQAWQHGPGVVWGLPVGRHGDELRVGAGLGVDGLGREVHLESSWCLSLAEWAKAWIEAHPAEPDVEDAAASATGGDPALADRTYGEGDGHENSREDGHRYGNDHDDGHTHGHGHGSPGTHHPVPEQGSGDGDGDDGEPCPPVHRTLRAWVVAEFASCPDRPVPALADPCDVTRRHDDFSRIVESARITVREDPPPPWRPYRRVRILLGLAEPRLGDRADEEAHAMAEQVAGESAQDRTKALLDAFRWLAAKDVTDLAPEREEGEACPSWAPVTEDHAGILLAELTVGVTEYDGCVRIGDVEVDPYVRTPVLPTTTIQELACGLAPGLLGAAGEVDAGGPRVIPNLNWNEDKAGFSFKVTKPLVEGSAEPDSIEISSLSSHGYGWATDEVADVQVTPDGLTVVVDLDQPPAYETVRIRIHGTGPKPLYGRDPHVPLAGLAGGPPGGRHEGHDAVIAYQLPPSSRESAAGRTES